MRPQQAAQTTAYNRVQVWRERGAERRRGGSAAPGQPAAVRPPGAQLHRVRARCAGAWRIRLLPWVCMQLFCAHCIYNSVCAHALLPHTCLRHLCRVLVSTHPPRPRPPPFPARQVCAREQEPTAHARTPHPEADAMAGAGEGAQDSQLSGSVARASCTPWPHLCQPSRHRPALCQCVW